MTKQSLAESNKMASLTLGLGLLRHSTALFVVRIKSGKFYGRRVKAVGRNQLMSR